MGALLAAYLRSVAKWEGPQQPCLGGWLSEAPRGGGGSGRECPILLLPFLATRSGRARNSHGVRMAPSLRGCVRLRTARVTKTFLLDSFSIPKAN